MYTYHHVISRLAEVEKIRLLTDLDHLSGPLAESLGLPRVSCASLGDTPDGLPTPALLARSWDGELMGEAAAAMTRTLSAEGVSHILLPPAASAVTPDGTRLSEDPLLSATLAGEMLAGVNRVGLTASLAGYGFTAADRARLDTPVSPRFFYQHVGIPTATVTRRGSLTGVILEDGATAYENLSKSGYFLLRRTASETETVPAILRGEILMKGSEGALAAALHTYRRLSGAISRGGATTGELETAVLAGEAMSPEALDAAVDRLLAFAYATERIPAEAVSPTADLRDRALDGSTVLLENRDNLLPLVKPTRICILGDAAREGKDVLPLVNALTAHGHTYLGYARGYDPASPRNDALTAEAAALATDADTVLVFVQTETGKPTLPAAQLALLDHVSRLRKRTVVILSSAVSPDMGFRRVMVDPPAGLLLIPAEVEGAALRATEILLGDRIPCGRLTETLPDTTHPAANRRGYRIGPFTGYRYYDTLGQGEGVGVAYPFGHGLGYTTLRYSHLRVDPNGTLTFTVTNTGKRWGVAIPQVYLGIRDSVLLRPAKELVGFARIPLESGEKRTVTIPFGDPLAPFTGVSEKGSYRLYVGESVSDIRLTADIPLGDGAPAPDGENSADYLPTITNIPTERYVLEAAIKPMKPSVRNLIFGISALALAVSIKLYDILTVSGSAFLSIVSVVLALGAGAFFLMEITDRKRQFARERAALEEANVALFKDAVDIPVPSADALFSFVDEAIAVRAAETSSAEEQDHFLDVDKTLTFPVAVKALTTLSAERGMTPESGCIRSILAAMASSRLLLARGMETEAFRSMMGTLATYFGCPVAVDEVDDTYTDEAALLYRRDEEGKQSPRAALEALESARRDPRTIHLVGLNGVTLDTLSAYFVPYTRYARTPHGACTVTTHDERGNETAYLLPENLWFVLNLRDGESLGNLPAYVSEVAALVSPAFIPAAPAAAIGEFAPFRYGQMLYLCDRFMADFATEEETWKRIDRLESYAARFSDFTVTNKLWLGLETYLAALLTEEPDPAVALDETLSARLMPALISALSGKLPREERSLAETLEAALGDGNATHCRKTLKESGADLT